MRFGLVRAVVLILATEALTFAGVSAQSADPAAEALARPMSPGSVALLLPYINQPAVIERLSQALADPRPEVRAVAARIAFTTRHQSLVPALTAALEKEQSPVAGTEIVRALALIHGAAADAAIRVALSRFDARATEAWAETVVRTRPGDLWPHVLDLPNAAAMGELLLDAVLAQPEAAGAAFANLRSTPSIAAVHVELLRQAGWHGKLPPWPLVVAGLETPGPSRQMAAFLLLTLRARDVELPPEATEAIRGLTSAADLPWVSVYDELEHRSKAQGSPHRPLRAQIDKIEISTMPDGLVYDGLTEYLDKDEAAAFRRIAGPDWKQAEAPHTIPTQTQQPPAGVISALDPAQNPSGSLTRLARPMSVALLRDLEAVLQCQPVAGHVALLDVKYRPTGQVRNVSRALGEGSSACLQVAAITAALEVAPGHVPPPDARVDRVVVGLRPSDLECERYVPARSAGPTRLGGRIAPPKKLRNVQPQYPSALVGERIQGVVVVEATLAPTGCVADARILRQVHPGLDFAAMAAVSEWLYEPLRVNGQPVPVIMTVTVNFALVRP